MSDTVFLVRNSFRPIDATGQKTCLREHDGAQKAKKGQQLKIPQMVEVVTFCYLENSNRNPAVYKSILIALSKILEPQMTSETIRKRTWHLLGTLNALYCWSCFAIYAYLRPSASIYVYLRLSTSFYAYLR